MQALRKCCNPLILAVVVFAVAALLTACGDTQRNNQGVSFTLTGWYASVPASEGETPPGVTTLVSSISDPNQEVQVDPTTGAGTIGGIVTAVAGLENNLSGQTIRVERAFHSYFVPEATLQVPDTSVGIPGILGPAPNNSNPEYGDIDSTLPESLRERGSISYSGIPIVTADVRAFINLNRHHFPEAPFVMVVETYVDGVTSAGNRISTNKIQIEIVFMPDNVIAPPGEGENWGTGGDAAALAEEDADPSVE